MDMELRDPEFAPALVNIRNSISRSPAATALVFGLGSYWIRRHLLGQTRLNALMGSAVMGISAAGALVAASANGEIRPAKPSSKSS